MKPRFRLTRTSRLTSLLVSQFLQSGVTARCLFWASEACTANDNSFGGRAA
jgi:hypothetical protein